MSEVPLYPGNVPLNTHGRCFQPFPLHRIVHISQRHLQGYLTYKKRKRTLPGPYRRPVPRFLGGT